MFPKKSNSARIPWIEFYPSATQQAHNLTTALLFMVYMIRSRVQIVLTCTSLSFCHEIFINTSFVNSCCPMSVILFSNLMMSCLLPFLRHWSRHCKVFCFYSVVMYHTRTTWPAKVQLWLYRTYFEMLKIYWSWTYSRHNKRSIQLGCQIGQGKRPKWRSQPWNKYLIKTGLLSEDAWCHYHYQSRTWII